MDLSLNVPTLFEQLLTAAQAAILMNVHPVTLLRWAREGLVPRIRVGRKIRFRASDLNKCITNG